MGPPPQPGPANASLVRVLSETIGPAPHFHSDSVLVWGPEWRRYILVAMVESDGGERILRDLVPVVEDVLQRRPARRRPTPAPASQPVAD